MKKVLFLIGSLQGGGAEKVLVDTVNALDPKKYQITVQTLFDEGIYKEKLSDHVRYRTVISCRSGFLRRAFAKILFYFMSTGFAYRMFVRDNYDYEIAFLEGLSTKVLSRSSNKKAKKYAWVHINLQELPGSVHAFGSEEKEAAAYDRFDRVFCVSKDVEKAFLEKYPSVRTPVSTLYNIVDGAAIMEAAKEPAELPTKIKPCLISAGRMTEQKGYDRLLRVHKRLIEEGYSHSLLILGEGDLRHIHERYIRENKLGDTAFLLGFQSNPYQYVSKADLFVCSSLTEGFSTVVTEAVLCGTPVLSTEVPGSREPIEIPRCSVVVKNDETALYEALRDILKNPEQIRLFRQEIPQRQAYFQKENLLARFEREVFSL